MAFWKKKNIKGCQYYYIYESYYQDGKAKQRMLEYVGNIDAVLALAMEAYKNRCASRDSQTSSVNVTHKEPTFDADEFTVKTYTHGDCMAMYYGAEMLDIRKMMDECFPQKTIKGLSRSEVLLLAMIYHATDPGSKRQFASWAGTTSLPYHLGFQVEKLDPQVFWEAMEGIDEVMIRKAWNRIVTKLETVFSIKPDTFHLEDHYFSFIDLKNGQCEICCRDHKKQKTEDLRQFSLAVLTAAELQIPLIWKLYDGKKNDHTEIAGFLRYASKTLTEMGYDISKVTIIFDGGSNSEEYFSDSRFHLVCPDSMTPHKELFEISVDNDGKQECIENAGFRVSEDVDHISICPQFHWTDQIIKVHVFCCLTAITIAEALRMKCKANGFDITKAAMLNQLHTIRDVRVIHNGKQVMRKLEDIQDNETARLWEIISTIKTDTMKKDIS